TLAAGDFTGTGQIGLLVRWSDGDTTLYPQVGAAGLGREIQMAAPRSAWQNAVDIAAGRVVRGTGTTRLLLRWSDGRLRLYTGVGAGGFGTARQLVAANGTWTKAAQLTGGTFNAGAGLLVRWTDGSLDTYTGTSAAGLGVKHRLAGPNGLWP